MILFPTCKINLGLSVLGKRADGYHDLDTVFYPLPYTDILEAVPAEPGRSPFSLGVSGLPIPGDPANNLCAKAYGLLKEAFPDLPPVQGHLHKMIPMGAGLGGGSSDGAFMLLLLNDLLGLGLSEGTLLEYAARLGSDCPFFIINKPCSAKGRGEVLKPIELDLGGYALVLVYPQIHVDTGWAFSALASQSRSRPDVADVVRGPVETWKLLLVNDFEAPVFTRYPAIATIKEELYRQGALYAAMSGSGSAVFGLFPKEGPPATDLFPDYLVQHIL